VTVRALRIGIAASPALGAVPERPGKGFQQRRFSRTVLADEERDGRLEHEMQPVAHDGDREGMNSLNDAILTQRDVGQERASRKDAAEARGMPRRFGAPWH